MEENIHEPLTANALAERLKINVSYLGRLFKSSMGVSPIAFLSQKRINRAARLLSVTDMRVSEVAKEVGLFNVNYFSRRFRSQFGVSAREYRKRGTPTSQVFSQSLFIDHKTK